MWWIQTTGYHLAGLVWLIVIAAAVVIAVAAVSTAGAAASHARHTRRMMRDHEAYHLAAGIGAANASQHGTADWTKSRPSANSSSPAGAPQDRTPPPPSVVDNGSRPADSSLGDSMRILHERYARGEITREEYLRAREDMMVMTR